MPAIAEILICRPAKEVWKIITDPATHPKWLQSEVITENEGEIAEGMKFRRIEKVTGKTTEGEIVSVKQPIFLKARTDLSEDCFSTIEYHLVQISGNCIVRVLFEIYDTGASLHEYFPEIQEERWRENLTKLKSICERV